MYGTKSGSRRAEWYSTFGAPYGIISPAPGVHRERRRIWSEALSNNALRGYESRIQSYTEKFIDILKKSATSKYPLDASKWCIYFSWDVMGNLGLDKDFSLLSTGQEHWALTLMAGWTKAIGLRLPPWSINLLKAIPGSSSAAQKFDDYCNDQLKSILAKRKASQENSSLMGIMASHAQSPPTKEDLLHLQSDCRSVIFAGSDTSASTLIFIFFYLAQHPEHVKKLRQELDPLAGMDGKFKHHSIQRTNHLNAVINETLRLQPPGSVLPRQTPSEGIMVQGTFVPGDVTVIGSQYVVGRSEEAYVRPLEFIPERWYAEPDLIKDRAGYAPFNVGE
ncbi:uncharacterized protein N0V89_010163 [Didymosphaeria variabile]|uniref:Cytochrome P450 n=1 Tax=Didymosphaeria variabile TaxID=1932322 RepID=A0A9W8XFC0_9PLEO|nr:uncharacterized protein N0V89_010163 [Didymosphaeria variabile]KAJ4348785.1 hypothetical protein N0V89_010163 [Didymosphaeria variabile]